MITFRQKEFTEYDAMKAFHNELCRLTDRFKFPICTKSELFSILKGNNVVIEKFVIASPFFGRDVYRMYIRVGLKAKMPEAIKLTDKQYDKRLGDFQLNFKSGNYFGSHGFTMEKRDGNSTTSIGYRVSNQGGDDDQSGNNNNNNQRNNNNNNNNQRNNNQKRNNNNQKKRNGKSKQKKYSDIEYSKGLLEQREFKGGGIPGWTPTFTSEFHPDRDSMSISYLVKETLGEAIVNDKETRTVVLEFKSIQDAIRVLNVLPFGLNYKIYLLDA
jgi:hypothetical protein